MNSPDELLHYLHGGWPSTKKHTALRSKVEKVRIDSLLESAEIINTRMSMLETWGDDETKENIHIKEIRALRPVYDAILARAKGVEGE